MLEWEASDAVDVTEPLVLQKRYGSYQGDLTQNPRCFLSDSCRGRNKEEECQKAERGEFLIQDSTSTKSFSESLGTPSNIKK